MIRRYLALPILIVILTGCDDITVTQLARRTFLNAPELAKAYATRPLPVELHGVPWPGADPVEVIGTLRMPNGPARGLRFQLISPGGGYLGGDHRLVLRFNPAETKIRDDCAATGPLPTAPPPKGRYTVKASYCKSTDWVVHAFLETKAEPDDWLAYYTAMAELLGKMFPEE